MAFTSKPSGAALAVDGVPRGTTPVTVDLPAGQHRYRVALSGYLAFEGTVDPREQVTVDVPLVASH